MATAGYGSAQGASLYPPTPPAQRSLKSAPVPECNLKINDRVVWISDVGPEHGVVKWIGYLPDSRRKEITVGVEFVSSSKSFTKIHVPFIDAIPGKNNPMKKTTDFMFA